MIAIMSARKRTISAVAIVLVVAAAVIGWWQLSSGEKPPSASAAEIVLEACDGLAEVNHDAVVVTADDEARVVQTFEISGGNKRMTGTVYEPPDSDTVTAKGELVVLDGVAYARESSPEHPTVLGPWEIWFEDLEQTSGPGTPCFGADTSNVARGADSDDSERHFIWRTETDGDTVTKHEFWVDLKGRPIRSLVTDTVTSSTTRDGSSGAKGESPNVDIIAEITYSGFGEENIITAPIAPPPSKDDSLSALALSDVALSRTFSFARTWYSAEVANDVEQTTVSPTTRDAGATYVVKLDGVADDDGVITLAVGENVITVEVTAEDGQTTTPYEVVVTRAAPPSTDATLSALALSEVTLSPAFASATTAYTADVANDVGQTTVTATAIDDGASYVVKLGGVEDADGTVDLAVGANVTTVEVTAEDGTTTKTYTVTVTRAAPVDSGNPTVSEVAGTSLRVSWDRIRPSGTYLQDVRVRYRVSGATDWTFGAYVDISTWSNVRQAATVSGLTCGTDYEFQIEAQYSNRWHHYGRIDAATSGC